MVYFFSVTQKSTAYPRRGAARRAANDARVDRISLIAEASLYFVGWVKDVLLRLYGFNEFGYFDSTHCDVVGLEF